MGGYDFVQLGSMGYFSRGTAGIDIYDLTEPNAPVWVSNEYFQYPAKYLETNGVHVFGIFASDFDPASFYVLDPSDSSTLSVVSFHPFEYLFILNINNE